MHFEIALVILPVFIVVTIGFISSYIKLLKRYSVDGLTKFCQDFGIPFLLFFNLAILDLDKAFDFRILICFYSSMVISFFIISCTSYFIFQQPYKSSIILGFCAMFSNGVLLGLPISELAYGADNLFINYTIIIRNTGSVEISNITLVDTLTDGASGTLSLNSSPTFVTATSGSTSSTVKPNGSITYSASYTIQSSA